MMMVHKSLVIVVTVATILVSLSSQGLGQPCMHGEIRLARNSTPFEGGIEVCVNNSVWGTVCNDFWGRNEIQVACRQLGFRVSGTETFIDLIEPGGPNVVIDNINCTGSEQNLTACLFSFEVSDCLGNITHKVGVRCHEERPPQNVDITVTETALNVTWTEPPRGIINDPVFSYNIECTRSGLNGISYKASGRADNTSTYIVIPIDITSSSFPTVYNCCVEAQYDTYSSIGCESGRLINKPLPQTTTEASMIGSIDQQLAVSNTSTAASVGGGLGAAVVILTLLLVLSVVGMVYMYRRMKIAEGMETTPRKRTLSSTSDGPEHIVENPMYGPSSHDVIHSGAEQYSSTGPDYEPMSRGPYDYSGAQVDNGGIVTQNENEYDHTSLNSVQV